MYIASALRNAGHKITIYNQDQYHYPEEHLTEYLNRNHFDVVGVSVIAGYYQYRKLLKISEAINKVEPPNRPIYILGGHGPSPEPEYFLKKTGADFAVIGEGEITVVELLKALQGDGGLEDVNGIAYNIFHGVAQTPPRPLIKDINTIALPAWDLFPMDYYALIGSENKKPTTRCFPVLSGRGCPFKCNFCYRMDKGLRIRSNESIIEEIQILKKDYLIGYIAFSDELLMTSKDRTISLCEDIIKAKLNVQWSCNGRLNYATPEVLQAMKRAGCVFINYGIESMSDETLKVMNKNLTTEQVIKGVEATLKEQISPGLNIIFGNIGETKETLQKGVDFLLRYDDHAQLRTIRPVTPYPGSPLYYYAIEHGMLKGCEDFYENKHVNSDLLAVNFTDMTDGEVHRALFEANKTLLENYYKCQLERSIKTAEKLYLEKDATFRGFRQN